MSDLIVGLYEDWLWLDDRIETVSREIEEISRQEGNKLATALANKLARIT
jgi:hypothetical protein